MDKPILPKNIKYSLNQKYLKKSWKQLKKTYGIKDIDTVEGVIDWYNKKIDES